MQVLLDVTSKTSRLSSLFRSHEISATAYLDMVNVFSSHDFYSRWVVQSHNSVLHRPKRKTIHLLVTEIVLCGTIPVPCKSVHARGFTAGQKLWKLRTRPPDLWDRAVPGSGPLAFRYCCRCLYVYFFFRNQSHSAIVIDAFIRGLKKREDTLSMPLRDP